MILILSGWLIYLAYKIILRRWNYNYSCMSNYYLVSESYPSIEWQFPQNQSQALF